MSNEVKLSGYVDKFFPPETKSVGNGKTLTKFRLSFKSKDNYQNFDCIFWDSHNDIVEGNLLEVTGHLKEEKWKTQEGQFRSKVVIVCNEVYKKEKQNEN